MSSKNLQAGRAIMPPCFLTKDTQCVLRNNSLVLGELWFLPTLLVLKVFSWNSVT